MQPNNASDKPNVPALAETALIRAIQNTAMKTSPPARPSAPSQRLIALTTPITANTVSGAAKRPSIRGWSLTRSPREFKYSPPQ